MTLQADLFTNSIMAFVLESSSSKLIYVLILIHTTYKLLKVYRIKGYFYLILKMNEEGYI